MTSREPTQADRMPALPARREAKWVKNRDWATGTAQHHVADQQEDDDQADARKMPRAWNRVSRSLPRRDQRTDLFGRKRSVLHISNSPGTSCAATGRGC